MTVTSDQSDRAISPLPKGHAHENSAFHANESNLSSAHAPENSASYANESILSPVHAHEKPLLFANELFRIIIKTSEIKLHFVHM